MQRGVQSVKVSRLGKDASDGIDEVSVEAPLEIVAVFESEGKEERIPVSITMRTPGDDANLSLGFLFSEGLIQQLDDITQIKMQFDCQADEDRDQSILIYLKPEKKKTFENIGRHFYTSSSCGVCGKTSVDLALDNCIFIPKKYQPSVSFELLDSLPAILKNAQQQFQRTGGLHACALFTHDGTLLHYAEDVGRHNALDKLVGHLLKSNLLPVDNHILLLSGRISFEMAQKAATIGCSMIAAIGAPSSLAIDICKTQGITLIGFLRNQSANVYCGTQRIQNLK